MTAQQLAQRWGRRVRRADVEFRKTMRGMGIAAVRFDKERMTAEIYAIPEDRSPTTGRKKWQRTRSLLRAERYEIVDAYTVRIVNWMTYAKPRHDAGKPGHRKINPMRESHWRDELVQTFQPILTDALRLTIEAIMRTP